MGGESSNGMIGAAPPVGKNIVLIGNGPSVLGSGLGSVIDKMDSVARCNLPTVKGFEVDVGSRTDLWMFGSNKRIRGIIAAVDAPETRMVLVTPHNEKKATKFINRLARLYAQRGMVFDWLKDEPRIKARYASKMSRRQRLTCGLGALVYLRHTYPDSHIYLHGFDYVCSDTPSSLHYWDPKERGLHGAHSILKEAVYIKELIAEGHVSVLTTDALGDDIQNSQEAPAVEINHGGETMGTEGPDNTRWQRKEDVSEGKWWNTCSREYAHIDIGEHLKSIESLRQEWESRWLGNFRWEGKTVVDYGCGGGHLGLLLFEKYNIKQYIGIDIAQRSREEAAKLLEPYADKCTFLRPPVDFSSLDADIFVSQACMQHFQSEGYYSSFLTNINQSGIPEVMLQFRHGVKRFSPSPRKKTKACLTTAEDIQDHLQQYNMDYASQVYKKTNYRYTVFRKEVEAPKLISPPPIGKNIVIVGSGPSVLSSGLGRFVDMMDTVVRCNLPVIAGFEKDVGSRTDVWAFNAAKGVRRRIPAMASPGKYMLLCTPFSEKKEARSIQQLTHAFVNKGVWFDWLKDPQRIEARYACDMRGRERLTTGVSAIVYFRHMYPDSHIYLHGFDYVCSDSPTALHYWDPRERTRLKSSAHDMTKESKYIKELIAEGHVSVLSSKSLEMETP